MSRSAIFLDIDGVLHPVSSKDEEQFSRLPLLADMLLDIPEWDVVISSDWRIGYSLDELKVFMPLIEDRITSKTPVLDIKRRVREHEIKGWLAMHVEYERFMVLDDNSNQFSKDFRSHLVETDPCVGLTDKDIRKISRIVSLFGCSKTDDPLAYIFS
jgi:hypothetical protein